MKDSTDKPIGEYTNTLWTGDTLEFGGKTHFEILHLILSKCGPKVTIDEVCPAQAYLYLDYGDTLTFRFDQHSGTLLNVYCCEERNHDK